LKSGVVKLVGGDKELQRRNLSLVDVRLFLQVAHAVMADTPFAGEDSIGLSMLERHNIHTVPTQACEARENVNANFCFHFPFVSPWGKALKEMNNSA